MSRIGKQNINIPSGISINIDKGLLIVKGPKGELSKKVDENIIKFNIGRNKYHKRANKK